ncbi:MAG: type 4a pilus biogenesis protein PilO [Gammaproteobacteria bacterium]|nr:type 4a pilus biogenesis protein PilO [Gammaproteobacteria bacterium]
MAIPLYKTYLNYIAYCSGSKRWLLIVGINLLLATSSYSLFLATPLMKFNQVHQQQQRLKFILQQRYRDIALLPQYEKNLMQLKKTLRSIRLQSSHTTTSQLIASISQIGKKSGIVFQLLKPQVKKITADHTMLPFNIIINGNYSQIIKFIHQLTRNQPFAVIRHFMLKTSKPPMENLQITMSLLLATYQPKVSYEKK